MANVASRDLIRFWSHVDTTGGPDACWPVTGLRPLANGYVLIRISGKQYLMHRLALAWSQDLDTPPPRLHADHLCHDPETCVPGPECPHRQCVNPRHLSWKTPKANNARSGSPSRYNAEKTECPEGHQYDAENTYVDRKGKRSCKKCMREAHRRWVARGGQRAAKPDVACPECGKVKPGRSFRNGVCGACDMRARRAAARA